MEDSQQGTRSNGHQCEPQSHEQIQPEEEETGLESQPQLKGDQADWQVQDGESHEDRSKGGSSDSSNPSSSEDEEYTELESEMSSTTSESEDEHTDDECGDLQSVSEDDLTDHQVLCFVKRLIRSVMPDQLYRMGDSKNHQIQASWREVASSSSYGVMIRTAISHLSEEDQVTVRELVLGQREALRKMNEIILMLMMSLEAQLPMGHAVSVRLRTVIGRRRSRWLRQVEEKTKILSTEQLLKRHELCPTFPVQQDVWKHYQPAWDLRSGKKKLSK